MRCGKFGNDFGTLQTLDTAEKLRQECGVNRDGSKASNIMKAAKRLNCEVHGYRWEAENVREEGEFPMIIPGLASPIFNQIFLDEILTGKHCDWMFNFCLAMTISFVICGVMNWL